MVPRATKMKIEVLDEFADMLCSFDKNMAPHIVVEALKWASEKPYEASRIVEGWKKLKSRGKREFQWRISLGSIDPAEALDDAVKYEARKREQSSLLRKVISKAKNDGYSFAMPNGVQCTIQYKEGEYWFIFNVAAEEVTLFYSHITYDSIEEATKYGHVSTRGLYTIVYNGKVYDGNSQIGRALLQAIEQNINPKVAVVLMPT